MQKQVTPQTYHLTETPGVYKRGRQYVVRWREGGRRLWAGYSTYEAACAFRRDYVLPYQGRRSQALPPSVAMPKRTAGWIYFFQSQGVEGYVKIGWTIDPATRLRTLSTAQPYGLELAAILPGTRALERAIHEHLKEYRLGREWYSREVLDLIGRLLAGSA